MYSVGRPCPSILGRADAASDQPDNSGVPAERLAGGVLGRSSQGGAEKEIGSACPDDGGLLDAALVASFRLERQAAQAYRDARDRALRSHLSESLRKGQARGEIDPNLDAEAAAAILISVIDGSKTLSVRDPKFDMVKSVELLKTLITRFLAPPESKASKRIPSSSLARRGSAARSTRI
ncbi:transcriptional repressor [Rhizobiales bacterium GAS188]|nr:transcriptional repressor [Rhizobiales bacterium GAS188]